RFLRGGRPRGKRVIGVLVLVPALLTVASSAFADGKPSRPSAKRSASLDQRGRLATSAPRMSAARCIHVVRSGDSVGRVAARYGVSRASLAMDNHLGSAMLRPGQRLLIPGCRLAPSPRGGQRDTSALVEAVDDEALFARVGPRRIPTRLHVGMPEVDAGTPRFQWPADGVVVSGFGRRWGTWHAGIDIKAELGDPIHAVAAGMVIVSTWEATYGWVVKLSHTGGFTSLYAHNLKNLVEVGDTVEAGTLIATVGRSGRATAAHVHIEIRRGEVAYNPLHLLDMGQTPLVASATETPPVDDGQDRE